MEEKSILLKIELDATSLTEGAKKAEENLKRLTPELERVAKESGKNTLEYKKLNAEVKANQKTLNDNATALQRYEALQKQNNGSLKEMRSLLSASKVAYAELTKEERENVAIGGKLVQEMDALNEQLKVAEAEYGVHTRKVGDYAGGLKGLKDEIRALKGQMSGLDAGSEEYQQAAKRAGELNDKLKEVNENTKANTGGTGFEKMSNNLGLVKDDLMNLDFEGVSEKMKQMAVISKSMTFSEVLGGLKNMGTALLNLGKAILANPVFLLAGAITGVVVALKMWNDSVEQEAIKAQDRHTESIQRNINALERQAERNKMYHDLTIRRAELEGKSAKELGKLKLDAFIQGEWDLQDQRDKWEKKKKYLLDKIFQTEDQERKDRLREQLKEANENFKNIEDLISTSGNRREILELEINKAIEDENKAHNDKIKQQNETAYAERLALSRKLRDLQLGSLSLSLENERAELEAHFKFMEDTAQGNADELLKIEEQKNSELATLDKKQKEANENNVKESFKRQIEDAKGNKAVIAELEKQRALELEKINIEYQNKVDEREREHLQKVKENNALKVKIEQQTADEIELIDAQLNLLKAKGTENEFSAWLQLRFAKIRQIESEAQREIELTKATGKAKEKIEKNAQLKIQALQNETFEKSKSNLKKETELTKEEKRSLAISLVNSAEQLASSLMQISLNQIQQELNDEKDKYDEKQQLLDQQLQAGLISQASYNAQKSVLDSEYLQKEKELKEKQFKLNKAQQLINATIATAVGVASALAAPPPVGLITAGIAGALGAAQVAIIASQPTPKFEKGGILSGASHANGGIPTPFGELEGGEAVINRNSTRIFMPLLSAINEAGGGKKFANGGVLQPMVNAVDNNLQLYNLIANTISRMPNPVVSVQDINAVSGRLTRVVERATF